MKRAIFYFSLLILVGVLSCQKSNSPAPTNNNNNNNGVDSTNDHGYCYNCLIIPFAGRTLHLNVTYQRLYNGYIKLTGDSTYCDTEMVIGIPYGRTGTFPVWDSVYLRYMNPPSYTYVAQGELGSLQVTAISPNLVGTFSATFIRDTWAGPDSSWINNGSFNIKMQQ